ncbi:histidine phosphatase family protein [Kineosporia rhizophila]|nr:histidine phosphatase family protein [Kineosporia rhizophila]
MTSQEHPPSGESATPRTNEELIHPDVPPAPDHLPEVDPDVNAHLVRPTAGDEANHRTVVHLLRHGEVYNPQGIFYGRLPGFRLSDLGHRMAERAAGFFATRDVVLVIASPMERAQQTAEPVAGAHDLEVGTDPRITEGTSVFQGLTFGVGDGSLRHPQHWWHLRNPFRPSWGEPYEQVAGRMLAGAADARDKAVGHEAVLVSHQLPIWMARLKVENRRLWHDPRTRECSLASVTSITYHDDRVVSVSYTEPSRDLLPGAQKIAGA